MADLIYKDEAYELVGICMEVHNELGAGLLEIIYKEAIEWELDDRIIHYEREKEYPVYYKDVILNHKFYADFVLYDSIILELKSCDKFDSKHIAQCINYLKVSNNKLAILANFNNKSLEHKRIVL